MSDKETAPTPEKFWEKWAEANPKDSALMASPNRWFKFAEAFAVECRAPAPQIERFGDWCDMKGIEPTMGQVDAFVREQVRAAPPQVTPTPAKTRRQYVYDWMSLPTHRKVEKLQELGLFEEGDYAIPGDEQDLVWIKRAKEKGLAEKLLSIEGTSEQASPTPEGNAFTKHDYGAKTCVHNVRLNDHCPSCGEVERG